MGAMPAHFAPTSLDHVALWVDEREPLAAFLCEHLEENMRAASIALSEEEVAEIESA